MFKILGAIGALALSSTAATSVMAAEAAPAAKPTVVLVHGAWADGSSWNKVIPLLQAKHIPVLIVQNPLTSLADDVAATARVLATVKGPVVLVGHSWGGTVITEAGNDAKVKPLSATAQQGIELFPDATLKVYEGAPHAVLYTHAERLNADLMEFISG